MAKAGAAQDEHTAEANYPAAYFATDIDRCISGLRSAHVPEGALFLTSTGSPFDPADPDLQTVFHTLWPTLAVTNQSYFQGSTTFACNYS